MMFQATLIKRFSSSVSSSVSFLRHLLAQATLPKISWVSYWTSCLTCCMAFGIFLSLLCLSPAPAAIALGGQQPPLNQPAPAFTLPSNSGDGIVSLSDYRGKWVVVYFYPKDFTPGCTLEAQRFQRDLPKYLERNTVILGISADDVDSHAEFCDSEGLRFPLLADVDGAVSKAYGAWLGYVSLRHTYILDPAGILRSTFLGVQPAIHSTEVLAKLAELQATDI